MKRKGFRHAYTLEQIAEYSRLSAREKLEWLEEANRFCAKALKGDRKRFWEMFRAGKI